MKGAINVFRVIEMFLILAAVLFCLFKMISYMPKVFEFYCYVNYTMENNIPHKYFPGG